MFGLFGKKEDEYFGEEWLSNSDRLYIPDYYGEMNPLAQLGAIEVVEERCDACGLCVKICPGDTLVLKTRSKPIKKGKKKITRVMSMAEDPQCVACGDCAAICPNSACRVSKPMRMSTSIFKTVNKGPLALPRLFNE